jgi:hypothetical protein
LILFFGAKFKFLNFLNLNFPGYGFYTPTTLLAKSLTTAYSLLGIPLFLLYLSVVGERLARIINRMTLSCCCCCNDNMAVISGDDEDDEENQTGSGRPGGRRRLGAYRQYSDVTLALQPMSFRGAGSNGHAGGQQESGSTAGAGQSYKDDAAMAGGRRRSLLASSSSACCSASPDTTQVPLLVCAGLLAIFVGLASFLLVLFEPQLGFSGSLHLTINLLMTLGFAGNLLPGMSAEAVHGDGPEDPSGSRSHPQGVGSQISLIIVACLILLGTTLLSSSFTVLMDNISQTRSASIGPADAARTPTRSATTTANCYHPSPTRQFS